MSSDDDDQDSFSLVSTGDIETMHASTEQDTDEFEFIYNEQDEEVFVDETPVLLGDDHVGRVRCVFKSGAGHGRN